MWSAPSPTARGGAQAHGAGQARRALTVASQRRPRTTQGDPLQGRKAALRGTRRRGRGGSGGGGGGGSSSDPRDAPDAPRHATRRGFAGPGVQQLLAPGDSDLESDDEDTPEEEAAAAAAAELSDGEVAALLGADTAAADVLAGADAGVEAELAGLLAKFEFKFDGFQVSAVRHLLCGRSVVVCAPTGAGKTAIAEAATHHFLARDRRVIYTTPLKALSNQKLGEMRARFGAAAAGLQTGDASINIEGDVVVMTTEILRNMLYRSEERGGGGDGGDDGDPQAATAGGAAGQAADRRAAAEERLAGVGLVVLDETHYLGDPGRGSVWEESIINMPKDVLILAMSATVRNPDDLAGWIGAVHGPCDAVTTSFRPVPLRWQYALSPGDGTARLLPLLGATGRALNPALLPASRRMEDAAAAAAAAEEDEWGRWDADPGGKAKGGPPPMRIRTLEELVEGMVEDGGWHRVPRWKRVPPVEATVAALAAEGMLPAIWFIFSRKECDAAAARLQGLGVQLTTPHGAQPPSPPPRRPGHSAVPAPLWIAPARMSAPLWIASRPAAPARPRLSQRLPAPCPPPARCLQSGRPSWRRCKPFARTRRRR
jgi:superfamily II RNA helicase